MQSDAKRKWPLAADEKFRNQLKQFFLLQTLHNKDRLATMRKAIKAAKGGLVVITKLERF